MDGREQTELAGLGEVDRPLDELEAARMEDKLRRELFGVQTGPRRLDRFTIVDRIGAGAMGAVYSAYDPQLDRKVAIKVLHRSVETEDRANARLMREARALAKLDHPNVVTVHEVGTYEDRLFVAMEFVEGRTLTQWLAGEHSTAEVLSTFVAAGRGLAAAHEAGLVHRDFKPDNVLVADAASDRGRVRVVDFGLVRVGDQVVPDDRTAASSDDVVARTMTGSVLGTPAYMAPEQHRGEPATPASDQFAFCVALFEALAGKRPFDADTRMKLLEEIEAGHVVEPSDRRVPARLRRAVFRGLSPDPADRWEDMNALLAQLHHDTRWRWWAAAVLVVGAATAAGAWAGVPREDPCEVPRTTLEQTYGPKAAESIASAFEGTGAPAAADIAGELQTRLDAYTQAWWKARQPVCAPQDERDVRAAICLDAELSALGALVGIMMTADQEVVRDALVLAPEPADLERCASVARVATSRPDAEVSGLVAQAEALSDAGRVEEGVALAEKALADAEAADNLGSQAHALVRLARARLSVKRGSEALELLDRATNLAELAGDDVARADALRARVSVLSRLDRVDEAEQVAALAEAALKRFPTRPVAWDVELDRLRGEIAETRKDYDGALEHYHEGLARLSTGATAPMARFTLVSRIANVHLRLGELEQSLHDEAELRKEIEAEYGSTHPGLASSWINSGVAAWKLHRNDEAETAFRHALALRERFASGPEDPSLAAVLTDLGGLVTQTRPAEGEQLLRRARAAMVAGVGERHRNVLSVDYNLAILLEGQSRLEEVEPLVTDALARARETLGKDSPRVWRFTALLASTVQARGEHARARELFESALGPLETEGNASFIPRAQCGLARELLDDDPQRAVALARRCHAIGVEHGLPRWWLTAACVLSSAADQGADVDGIELYRTELGTWRDFDRDAPHVRAYFDACARLHDRDAVLARGG